MRSLIVVRRVHAYRLGALVLILGVAIIGVAGSPADAHTFLVTTSPEAGQRRADAPTELTRRFTEAFAPTSPKVTLRTGTGLRIPTGRPRIDDGGSTTETAATTHLLLGLVLSIGGLASERFVWRPAARAGVQEPAGMLTTTA